MKTFTKLALEGTSRLIKKVLSSKTWYGKSCKDGYNIHLNTQTIEESLIEINESLIETITPYDLEATERTVTFYDNPWISHEYSNEKTINTVRCFEIKMTSGERILVKNFSSN